MSPPRPPPYPDPPPHISSPPAHLPAPPPFRHVFSVSPADLSIARIRHVSVVHISHEPPSPPPPTATVVAHTPPHPSPTAPAVALGACTQAPDPTPQPLRGASGPDPAEPASALSPAPHGACRPSPLPSTRVPVTFPHAPPVPIIQAGSLRAHSGLPSPPMSRSSSLAGLLAGTLPDSPPAPHVGWIFPSRPPRRRCPDCLGEHPHADPDAYVEDPRLWQCSRCLHRTFFPAVAPCTSDAVPNPQALRAPTRLRGQVPFGASHPSFLRWASLSAPESSGLALLSWAGVALGSIAISAWPSVVERFHATRHPLLASAPCCVADLISWSVLEGLWGTSHPVEGVVVDPRLAADPRCFALPCKPLRCPPSLLHMSRPPPRNLPSTPLASLAAHPWVSPMLAAGEAKLVSPPSARSHPHSALIEMMATVGATLSGDDPGGSSSVGRDAPTNHDSAIDRRSDVWDWIQGEVDLGNMSVISGNASVHRLFHLAPLGAVPKGEKVRPVSDFSWGEASVNSSASTTGLRPLRLLPHSHVMRRISFLRDSVPLGREDHPDFDIQLVCLDVASAYRSVGITTPQRPRHSHRFNGSTIMHNVMPFGARTSGDFFGLVSGVVCDIAMLQDPSCFWSAFVDDHVGIFFRKDAPRLVNSMRAIFASFGLEVSEKKFIPPGVEYTVLGVHYNTRTLSVSIDGDRRRRLLGEIDAIDHRGSRPIRAGQLVTLSSRIRWLGSCFRLLRPLASALASRLQPAERASSRRKVVLDDVERLALALTRRVVTSNRPFVFDRRDLPPPAVTIEVAGDASMMGYGLSSTVLGDGSPLFANCGAFAEEERASNSINSLEFATLFAGVVLAINSLRGSGYDVGSTDPAVSLRIVSRCDNSSVASAVARGHSPNTSFLLFLICLACLQIEHPAIDLHVLWTRGLSTQSMTLADELSRWATKPVTARPQRPAPALPSPLRRSLRTLLSGSSREGRREPLDLRVLLDSVGSSASLTPTTSAVRLPATVGNSGVESSPGSASTSPSPRPSSPPVPSAATSALRPPRSVWKSVAGWSGDSSCPGSSAASTREVLPRTSSSVLRPAWSERLPTCLPAPSSVVPSSSHSTPCVVQGKSLASPSARSPSSLVSTHPEETSPLRGSPMVERSLSYASTTRNATTSTSAIALPSSPTGAPSVPSSHSMPSLTPIRPAETVLPTPSSHSPTATSSLLGSCPLGSKKQPSLSASTPATSPLTAYASVAACPWQPPGLSATALSCVGVGSLTRSNATCGAPPVVSSKQLQPLALIPRVRLSYPPGLAPLTTIASTALMLPALSPSFAIEGRSG